MTNIDSSTLRGRTLAKLDAALLEGQPVEFTAQEAKLAGIFQEDAISVDDIDGEETKEDLQEA